MRNSGLLFVLLLAASPYIHAAKATCGLDDVTTEAVKTILALPPDRATSQRVTDIWPSSLPWGSRSEAGGTPTTFSHLAYVFDDECLCCDALVFESNGPSGDRLTAVTLTRLQNSEKSARRVAKTFAIAVAGTKFDETELPYVWQKQITEALFETARITVERVPLGWRIRATIFRTRTE